MKIDIYKQLCTHNEIIKNDIHYNIEKVLDILCIEYIEQIIEDGLLGGILQENYDFTLTEQDDDYMMIEKDDTSDYLLSQEEYCKLRNVINSIKFKCL